MFFLLPQLVLAACSYNPEFASGTMNRPLDISASADYFAAMDYLETELSDLEYQLLVDSLATLQEHDSPDVSDGEFYKSLSGLSPNQIIEKAEQVCRTAEC